VAGFSTRRAARVFTEKERKEAMEKEEYPEKPASERRDSTTWWISIGRLNSGDGGDNADIYPLLRYKLNELVGGKAMARNGK